MKISQNLIRELTYLDKENGELFWKERGIHHFNATENRPAEWQCNSWNAKNAGKKVGRISAGGYVNAYVFGNSYPVHRLIWLYEYGEWPDFIDHENGNKGDNRLENLSNGSHHKNMLNRKISTLNLSGKTGVYLLPKTGRYRVEINFNYERHRLGSFDTFEEACEARDLAEIKYGFHENNGKRR